MRMPETGDKYIADGYTAEILSIKNNVVYTLFTNTDTGEITEENGELTPPVLRDINNYWRLVNSSVIKKRLKIK